jgi:hypothetical protein
MEPRTVLQSQHASSRLRCLKRTTPPPTLLGPLAFSYLQVNVQRGQGQGEESIANVTDIHEPLEFAGKRCCTLVLAILLGGMVLARRWGRVCVCVRMAYFHCSKCHEVHLIPLTII